MQSEIESMKRLKSPKSKVSCHYIINKLGLLTQLVPEKKVAWHAGKSKWQNFRNLNDKSIGIELVNKGHKFRYENFSKRQIKSLIRLCTYLKRKYKIKKENFLGHSDIAPLRKIDPGEKFPWEKLSKFNLGVWYKKRNFKYAAKKKIDNEQFFKNLHKIGYRYFAVGKPEKRDKMVIKAFQRKYLPNKISGKIDRKTLEISNYFANSNK